MNLIYPTYKIKNVDIRELLFVYDFHKYGDDLVHRFPVYKYNNKPIIFCEFVIRDYEDNQIHINVYDQNRNSYSYNEEEYGKSKVVESINETIQDKINHYIKKGLIVPLEEC